MTWLSPATVEPLSEGTVQSTKYDLFVAAIGFEKRARYVAEQVRPQAVDRVAYAFAERHDLSFAENLEVFAAAGFDCPEVASREFQPTFAERFEKTRQTSGSHVTICVDASSATRRRLASIIATVSNSGCCVTCDFIYAVGKYSPPQREPEPIENAGPVLPEFAGWQAEPSGGVTAIFGLGYEPEKAVGAYEYLEACEAWTFLPMGTSKDYDRAVRRANKLLFQNMPKEQIIEYCVDRPFDAFSHLELLIKALPSDARPVILPFGPKVFAVVSLLAATRHPTASVWRISSGQLGKTSQREASGQLALIRAVFRGRLTD